MSIRAMLEIKGQITVSINGQPYEAKSVSIRDRIEPPGLIELWNGREWRPASIFDIGTGHIVRFRATPHIEYRAASNPYTGLDGDIRIKLEEFAIREIDLVELNRQASAAVMQAACGQYES